jgi:Alpha/beta hydrolase
VTRPTVSQAEAWRPDSLREAADSWYAAAMNVHTEIDIAVAGVESSHDFWTGSAADAARQQALELGCASDALARAMVMAAVAAQDGAGQLEAARADVMARVDAARVEGFAVADDGTASVLADPPPLLVALSGGSPDVAHDMLTVRAAELTAQIVDALDRLGAADADAAEDIAEAFAAATVRQAATVPAGAWPRDGLTSEAAQEIGNTDGVPWDMRVAANRVNIAQAIVDEHGDDPGSQRRIALYRSLLGEIDDPAGSGQRVDRQILAFDPVRGSLIELNGNLSTAKSVAVLVPGLNTTIEGSAANTQTARRFVSATRGDVVTITYLGGPFPRGNPVTGLVDAANPRYALDMAPRLVAFSQDVDRTVDAFGRAVPVTYIGHSYGGSILGTAEALGLTADRTLYVAAAGSGVGVDDPGDWHNRNPDVLRFSMTAPGDFIEAVQGVPGGPHGADPDEMPGVIHLATGHYDDGRLVAGWRAHTDVLNWPSDAWRNILAVITGDRERIQVAG